LFLGTLPSSGISNRPFTLRKTGVPCAHSDFSFCGKTSRRNRHFPESPVCFSFPLPYFSLCVFPLQIIRSFVEFGSGVTLTRRALRIPFSDFTPGGLTDRWLAISSFSSTSVFSWRLLRPSSLERVSDRADFFHRVSGFLQDSVATLRALSGSSFPFSSLFFDRSAYFQRRP